MANFNKVKKNHPNAISYEGGAVYNKSVINEWMGMLFSSFMEDAFYETAETQQKRFIELTEKMAEKYGYTFIAKCAVFARNELGMRSISQLLAAWINDSKFDTKRAFYRAFCHRPDDVAEIFAAVDYLNQKRSHALIRGCSDYISTLKPQAIAKYKLNSRNYNMYDLINITHATSDAINQYKQGILEEADTWEVKIAGADSKEQREKEWKRLVEQHKLGYMALIRNLNNILSLEDIDQDWIDTYLVPQIIAETAIKKSLIFPYRFYTAYRNLKVTNLNVVAALGKAFKIASCSNAPQLDGSSAIILDVSGSMDSPISKMSNITIKEVGACFAVSLFLSNPDCIIVKFGNYAKIVHLNKNNDPFAMIQTLCANDGCGYGTDIIPAFKELHIQSKDFSRVFIISDMQVMDNKTSWGWGSYYNHKDTAVNIYHKYFHNLPCYSFDLGHYKTQILSEYDHIRYVTALNDQVFKFIGLLESNIDLVDYINNITYC